MTNKNTVKVNLMSKEDIKEDINEDKEKILKDIGFNDYSIKLLKLRMHEMNISITEIKNEPYVTLGDKSIQMDLKIMKLALNKQKYVESTSFALLRSLKGKTTSGKDVSFSHLFKYMETLLDIQNESCFKYIGDKFPYTNGYHICVGKGNNNEDMCALVHYLCEKVKTLEKEIANLKLKK